MKIVFYSSLVFSIFLGLKFSQAEAAEDLAQSFTLDGRLFSDPGATIPLSDLVSLKIQILNPAQDCILYEETQNVNTTASSGYYTIQIGQKMGPPAGKRSGGDSNNSLAAVFTNTAGNIAGKQLVDGTTVCSYTPSAGHARYMKFTMTPTDGIARTTTTNMLVDSVPSAIVAERAENLRGYTPDSFIKVNTTTANISQASFESIFTSTGISRLGTLVSVPPTDYLRTGTNGSTTIPAVSGNPGSGLTAGQIWYDSGTNVLKYYDGAVKTIGTASGGGFADGGNTFTATATIGTNSAHNLEFETNGTTRMAIDSTGRVGIGVAPAGYGFQVAKDSMYLTNSAGTRTYLYADGTGNLAIGGSSSPGARLHITNASTTTINSTGLTVENTVQSTTAAITKTGFDIQSTGTWTGAGATNVGLNVNVSGGTSNYAALLQGGNVGIGINAPLTPLHVVSANGVAATFKAPINTGVLNVATSTGSSMLSISNNWDNARMRMYDDLGNEKIGLYAWGASGPHIYANASLSDSRPDGSNAMQSGIFIKTKNQLGYENGITFGDNDASLIAPAAITFYDTNDFNTHSGGLKFKTSNSGSGQTTRMTIDSAGNVGIGETVPTAKLHIKGDLKIDDGVNSAVTIKTSGAGLTIGAGAEPVTIGNWGLAVVNYYGAAANPFSVRAAAGQTANLAEFQNSGGTAVTVIDATGRIGVGTTPSEKVHVLGNLRVQGSTDCTLGNGAGGTMCSSDFRLKENIQPIDEALSKVLSLTGVEFDWNQKASSPGRHDIGVIAQEVEKVFPTSVTVDPATGYRKVDYASLVAPLIESIKKIYQIYLIQKSENEELKAKNRELEIRLEAIEKKLGL